jgi:protein SCO1/2
MHNHYLNEVDRLADHLSQPFSWKAGLLFVATCAGLVWYFEFEKGRMQRKRIADASKGVGRPKVGGPFELVDQNGKPFSSEMMKGKYSLVRLVAAG